MSANIETVKSVYDAFTRGDVETILGRCSDDVDWATEAAGNSAPWHGPRIGKDKVVGFFTGIGEAIDVTEFTQLGIAGNDSGEVFVLLRFGFKSKETGRDGSMNLHHYWRFSDAGQIECYRGSEDTELVASVLSGQPVAA